MKHIKYICKDSTQLLYQLDTEKKKGTGNNKEIRVLIKTYVLGDIGSVTLFGLLLIPGWLNN